MNQNSIIIDQALHGYKDGHQLLASSIRLNSSDERLMLILSDMSGSSITTGFESYITGYPLEATGKYVFAKTWYAPEMNRPGCVWTHSLIIDNNDICFLPHPQLLQELFRRPSNVIDNSYYSKSHTYSENPSNSENYFYNTFLIQPKEDDFVKLLQAIYLNSKKQVFIPSINSEEFSDALLKIWELQGSGLRSSFAFCTGSIDSRSTSDITFDVQIIPIRNYLKIKQKNREEIFIDDSNYLSENPSWIKFLETVIHDQRKVLDLRIFLNACDSDLKDRRGSYSKLITIFYETADENKNKTNRYANLITTISNYFPKQNDAINLKRYFLYNTSDLSPNKPINTKFLEYLCITDKYKAFNPKMLLLKENITNWVISEEDFRAISIMLIEIVNNSPNPIGELVIKTVSQSATSNNSLNIIGRSDQLMQLFLFHNPTLGLNSKFWHVNENLQKERLYIIINSPNLNKTDITEFTHFFLNGKNGNLIIELLKNFEDITIFAILNWINSTSYSIDDIFQEPWIFFLIQRSDQFYSWLTTLKVSEISHNIIPILIRSLDPNSKMVLNLGITFWINLSKKIIPTFFEIELTNYYIFILTIAVNSYDLEVQELILMSFKNVYNAAKFNSIPFEFWQKLSQNLPETPMYRSWDKCLRLRTFIIKRFETHLIEPEYFFISTNEYDLFTEIISYAKVNTFFRRLLVSEAYVKPKNKNFISKDQMYLLNKLVISIQK